MLEKLKTLGSGLLGILGIAAIFLVIVLLIGGAGWLSEHLFRWFSFASSVAFIVLIVVLLPLSAFRATRSFSAVVILLLSYLFGATLWMEGLLLTLGLWGTWAVIIGLCLAGVGIVPLGMLAALFHGEWYRLLELILLAVLTFATRFYALWLGERTDKQPERDLQGYAGPADV